MKSLLSRVGLLSIVTQALVLGSVQAGEIQKDVLYKLTSRKCSDGTAIVNEPWSEEELIGKFTVEFKSTGRFVVVIDKTEMVNSEYRLEGRTLKTINQPSGAAVESAIEVGEASLKIAYLIPKEQRAQLCPSGAESTVAVFSSL